MRQEKLTRIQSCLSESILGAIIGSHDVPWFVPGAFIGTIFMILLAFFSSLFNVLGNGYSFTYLLILSYVFGFGFVFILKTAVEKCAEEIVNEFETQIASNQLTRTAQTKSNDDTERTINTNVVARIELNKTDSNKFAKTDTDTEEVSDQKEETVKSAKETPSKRKDDDVNYPSDPRNPSHSSSIGTSSLFNSANMF